MGNATKTVTAVMVLLVLVIVMTINGHNKIEWRTKSAPRDPFVSEAIGQARALQKLGKLKEAFVVFEKYAERGYPEAMFYTAKSYSRGWGVKPDLDKAREYALRAVQYGFSYRGETAYQLGRLFQRSHGPDCNTVAIEWFKKALKWNFMRASLQLAIHYERGLGTAQDIAEARKFYEISVSAGDEQAMIKYARLLVEGRHGVVPDLLRAQLLSEQAVVSLAAKGRGGSGSAAKQLGRIYRNGKLVPANLKRAHRWLLRSARLGNTGGMHDLAHLMLADRGTNAKHDEALVWLQLAARQGHGGAMTALGRFHLKKVYGLKRIGAVGWFEMGVRAEHSGAMEEMAKLQAEGVLVEKNLAEAIRLARRGADLGHSGSQKLLRKLLDDQSSMKSPENEGTGENHGF